MSMNHRDGYDNSDQNERIAELKQQAERAAKGEILAWESDLLSLPSPEVLRGRRLAAAMAGRLPRLRHACARESAV